MTETAQAIQGTATTLPDLERLDLHILAARTVTEALEAWCDLHAIGSGPVKCCIIESRLDDRAMARPKDLPSPPAPIAYRKVELVRQGLSLCQAEIWFQPSDLPQEILQHLQDPSMPFGRAVLALNPYRETTHRSKEPDATQSSADIILEHRARIFAGDHRCLGVTRERFTSALLPA